MTLGKIWYVKPVKQAQNNFFRNGIVPSSVLLEKLLKRNLYIYDPYPSLIRCEKAYEVGAI